MRNAAATRQKLLETALQLVWQSSYDNVGVNEICLRAGVTKGAFYHHFETKADLFYAASQRYWEELKHELDAILSPRDSPLEHLENLIEFIIERQKMESLPAANEDSTANGEPFHVAGCPFFTAGAQVGVEEAKVRQAATEMADNAIRYNVALVRGLQAEGCLDSTPDIPQVARMIFTFIQGLLIYARTRNSLTEIETDLREGLYRLIDLKAEFRRVPSAKNAVVA
ncbi:MAG: TetR/AcrR family transcriptional regulator [Pseudomonadota bacterium]|nr:TetR/AcrR family transcriptional regulator [Pseudomonadota bacterium]